MDLLASLELILLAMGLSADAFAVSICKGLATGKVKLKHALIVGAWFGGFQALMPTLGYLLGSYAHDIIEAYDHWIAFVLLLIIGINMIREAFDDNDEGADASFAPKKMLTLAIATSIDALAVGIAIAMSQNYNIGSAAVAIGIITFALSAVGLYIGAVFGEKYKRPASVAGGVILILIGVKILLEHLGFIG